MNIEIFGNIGQDVTVESFRQSLAAVPPTEPLTVEINSDGGSVDEAVAIYATLRAWPGGVTTIVTGWALSAASLILMAGTRRVAAPISLVMIHSPWSAFSGNAQGLREHAAALDQVAQSMLAAYRRSGQRDSTIDGWFDGADHWFTADQALAAGLVTDVSETALAISEHVFASCRYPVPSHVIERMRTMQTPTPAAPQPDIAAAARQAEFHRQQSIRAMFKPFQERDDLREAGLGDVMAQCLNDMNCDPEKAGQRVLALLGRDTTPVGGRGHESVILRWSDRLRVSDFVAAATDVLLMRSGIRIAEPHPAVRDLQRMSVVAMAERVCSINGVSTTGMSQSAIVKAALSTSDFPRLLSDTANKALLNGYDSASTAHTAWTSQREVPDFKTNTLLVLSETPLLELVPEGAEYRHGALSEAAESFAIAKYGRIVRLTREAMINDDLSAFTAIPEKMGASARRLEADKVYGRLTDNPTVSDGVALFHANHGNLAAVAAAPSVTSLGVARAAMRKQKGIAGRDYIDPQPRFLIVPVALETLCEQLLASLADPAKSNDTTNPAWIRGLTLVADPRLDAASETAWYLAAAPSQIEGIARAYLQGETAPQIDTEESFDVDAMAWKVRHEFAATVVGWRALYKNAGAAA